MNTKTPGKYKEQLAELSDGLDTNIKRAGQTLRLGQTVLGTEWLHFVDRQSLVAARNLLKSGMTPEERVHFEYETAFDRDNGYGTKLSDQELFDSLSQNVERNRDAIIAQLTEALDRDSHIRGLVDTGLLPPFIEAQIKADTTNKPNRTEMRRLLAEWLNTDDVNQRHQRLELLLRWYTDFFELVQPNDDARAELTARSTDASEREGGIDQYSHARMLHELGAEAVENARVSYLQAVQTSIDEGWQSYDVLGFIKAHDDLRNIRIRFGDTFSLEDKGMNGYVMRGIPDEAVVRHPIDAGSRFDHTYYHEVNHLTGRTELRWFDEALTEHRAMMLLDRTGERPLGHTPRDIEDVSPLYDTRLRGSYPYCRSILSMMLELCEGQVSARDLTLAHTSGDEEAMDNVMLRINQALGTKHFVYDIEKEIIKHQVAMQGVQSEKDLNFDWNDYFEEATALVAQRLAKVVATQRMITKPKNSG